MHRHSSDAPKNHFKNGVTNVNKLTAAEVEAAILQLPVVLGTSGVFLPRKAVSKIQAAIDLALEVKEMMWTDTFYEAELPQVDRTARMMLKALKAAFCGASASNFCFPKFHHVRYGCICSVRSLPYMAFPYMALLRRLRTSPSKSNGMGHCGQATLQGACDSGALADNQMRSSYAHYVHH